MGQHKKTVLIASRSVVAQWFLTSLWCYMIPCRIPLEVRNILGPNILMITHLPVVRCEISLGVRDILGSKMLQKHLWQDDGTCNTGRDIPMVLRRLIIPLLRQTCKLLMILQNQPTLVNVQIQLIAAKVLRKKDRKKERYRQFCATVQSDQDLLCPLTESNGSTSPVARQDARLNSRLSIK